MGRRALTLALIAGCGAPAAGPDAGAAEIADAGIDAAPADPRFDDLARSGVIQVLEIQAPFGGSGIAQAAYLDSLTRMRFVHYAQIVAIHLQVETCARAPAGCSITRRHSAPTAPASGHRVCEPLPVYVAEPEFTGLTPLSCPAASTGSSRDRSRPTRSPTMR
jgi:hypothetical protein